MNSSASMSFSNGSPLPLAIGAGLRAVEAALARDHDALGRVAQHRDWPGCGTNPTRSCPPRLRPCATSTSPRSSKCRSSWRIRIDVGGRGCGTACARGSRRSPRCGRRVRACAAHSANTSVSSWRYSAYEDGMPSRSSSSSYCLPAKYGGDVTTSATEPSTIASMWRASPSWNGSTISYGSTTRVVARDVGCVEALVERGRVVALALADAEVRRGRSPPARLRLYHQGSVRGGCDAVLDRARGPL